MRRTRTSLIGLVMLLLVVMIVSGCGKSAVAEKVKSDNSIGSNNEADTKVDEATNEATNETDPANGAATGKDGKNPVVTLEMASGTKFGIELYPDIAPITVTNFVNLVSSGYYDGLIFHRVIPGFMIQGGDPDGTGMGGPGYEIKGEFSSNGFDNKLAHEEGVISMARNGDNPDSAGSQFFIVTKDSPHLDGDYAAFGKVVKGIEGLPSIENVETDAQARPIEDQVIKKMTVETFGVEYGEPEKITP
jgi:peptidyl-prolyl cis-trans isomerase B (cyclophilin B)